MMLTTRTLLHGNDDLLAHASHRFQRCQASSLQHDFSEVSPALKKGIFTAPGFAVLSLISHTGRYFKDLFSHAKPEAAFLKVWQALCRTAQAALPRTLLSCERLFTKAICRADKGGGVALRWHQSVTFPQTFPDNSTSTIHRVSLVGTARGQPVSRYTESSTGQRGTVSVVLIQVELLNAGTDFVLSDAEDTQLQTILQEG